MIKYKQIKSIVCATRNESCITGQCPSCKGKELQLINENDDINVKFFEWKTTSEKKVIKGVERELKRIVKTSREEKLAELNVKLKKDVLLYKKHIFAMYLQAHTLKLAKDNKVWGACFPSRFLPELCGKVFNQSTVHAFRSV